MQITTDAPERKPDVIVRLTPKEARLVRIFFGEIGHDNIKDILASGELEDETAAVNDVVFVVYESLCDLGY